jgi:hypothetical protein
MGQTQSLLKSVYRGNSISVTSLFCVLFHAVFYILTAYRRVDGWAGKDFGESDCDLVYVMSKEIHESRPRFEPVASKYNFIAFMGS